MEHGLVGGEDLKDTVQASSQSIRRASRGTAVIKVRGKEDREDDVLHATRMTVEGGSCRVVVSHCSNPPSHSLQLP